MQFAHTSQEASTTAPAARPTPVTPDGTLIDLAVFQGWLSEQCEVNDLRSLLAEVTVKSEPATNTRLLDDLLDAVTWACRGAYAFEHVDGRAALRASDAAVRQVADQLRGALAQVRETLADHSVRLTQLTEYLQNSLRGRHDKNFSFPWPREHFVLDLLELLGKGLDSKPPEGAHQPPHVTCHGCLDYMRPIQGLKTRGCGQMLAFNLEFLFRGASAGTLNRTGRMPQQGRPHRQLVARLVAATLPEAETDTPITFDWVASAVKSIQRDNSLVEVVAWPMSRDQVGFDTWYAPIEPHE